MTTSKLRILATATAVALSGLLGAGCADDDDEPAVGDLEETRAAPTGAASDPVAYCALASELDERAEEPTEAELTELEDVAPPEIEEQVRILTEAVRTGDFADPDVQQAESEVIAWEDDNCPDIEPEEPGDDS
jgi:hypothetical protein